MDVRGRPRLELAVEYDDEAISNLKTKIAASFATLTPRNDRIRLFPLSLRAVGEAISLPLYSVHYLLSPLVLGCENQQLTGIVCGVFFVAVFQAKRGKPK